MINWNKINEKISVNKIVLPLFMVILILLSILYISTMNKIIKKNDFVKKSAKIAIKNETPAFSIQKIYLCSSANAIDSSTEQKLNKLDLYQYTDIAIYINNFKDEGLTTKNTIKELYIDNISLDLDYNIGKTSLVYTNMLKIGSKQELANIIKNNKNIMQDRINFKIINNNEQNNQENYEEPTFYADCSNPITLKYINQLNREYSVTKGNSATFDGTILKKVGIKPEDINVKINFKINIVNHNDETYTKWINFKLPLDDIENGTSIKSKETEGKEYNFFTL